MRIRAEGRGAGACAGIYARAYTPLYANMRPFPGDRRGEVKKRCAAKKLISKTRNEPS